MNTEISITVRPEEEKNEALIQKIIRREIKIQKGINVSPVDKLLSVFIKKSIDARHGQVKIHLRYKIYINENPEETQDKIPEWKKADGKKSVLIIGSGPAGLFGALTLLEKGIKPVIIERGSDTARRRKDIALISTKNQVNENSNYCFGEGGAGTFSDGKLYTRSNKRGDIGEVLRIFAHFGADKKILTDAHPHIGTDRLPKVINAMREKIIELGGEIHFDTKMTGFITEDSVSGAATKIIRGIHTEGTASSEKKDFYADAVLLCTGHSASDVYKIVAEAAPDALEAKTFAAGVRVEHPRELIDAIQFHGKKDAGLGAAEYRVTTQVEGRGVYSFCMCPGGFVVPSASGPDEIVVNGMSTASRNSKWSNAAIVVEIRPEDIPEVFVKQAEEKKCPALAGLLFRTFIEKKAKENGDGQAAPSQMMKDFIAGKKSASLIPSSYTPGTVSSDLNTWLPEHISNRLKEGFKNIDKNMHGFISDSAILIAPETRTSTPVRIVRDKESFECTGLKNLYPCGEGSGYSGGIVSSAMDGQNACKKIIQKFFGEV